jgi:tetratricopeptide (TPR) repeat protein
MSESEHNDDEDNQTQVEPTLALRQAVVAAAPAMPNHAARMLAMDKVMGQLFAENTPSAKIDRFVLEDKIGAGGMGAVYRARDAESNETVAIKILERASPDDRARFARESHLLAVLDHPAIVRYRGHGFCESGEPYLVMEWIDGCDLAGYLRNNRVTIEEATDLTKRLAQALMAAHAHGIVHRDLKPANILLPAKRLEFAKLSDFGIARQRSEYSDQLLPSQALTRTGVLLGTPAYMAPEQIQGQKHLDARSDLFALGCTIYECLAGRPVFSAEHIVGVLARVLFQDPLPLHQVRPEIPVPLSELVARLLAKEPSGRPPNAGAVVDEVLALGPLTAQKIEKNAIVAHLSPLELQVVSLVIVRHEGSTDVLRGLAQQHGARLERVTSSTVVAMISGRAAAVDLVAQGARFAFAVLQQAKSGLAVDAGIVLATGRGEWSSGLPVGEAIDRGARLLVQTRSGIAIDEVSAALLSSRFELEYESEGGGLVGLRPHEGKSRTLLGREMPCVGRERELSLLNTTLDICERQSRAHVVLVVAQAGLGKSRLAQEWRKHQSTQEKGRTILIGRAEPVSSGSPFYLAAQLVRRALGLREDDVAQEQWQLLRQKLRARKWEVDAPSDPSWFLGEMLGLHGDVDVPEEIQIARANPLLMGDKIRVAWEEWLADECEAAATVLILEDLHWADASSVRLIDGALRHLRQCPLMILALARPEVHERFPALWPNLGVHQIYLGELSREDSDKLVRAALGHGAQDLTIEWISERAGGHALYLEETIRAVAAGRRNGAPESVLAMVQARLAAYSPDSRRVLRAASIFGEVFWRGGIDRLAGRLEASIDQVLDELIANETIVYRRRSRFSGEAEYAFRHSLFREAAQQMLTSSDRVLGHLLAAQWLIAAGERQSMVLAEHLAQGGRPEQAIEWTIRAAQEALMGNDFDGAQRCTEYGLSLGAQGEERGRLLLIDSEARTWKAADDSGEAKALDALEELPRHSDLWYDALRYVLAARIPARRESLDFVVAELKDSKQDAAASQSLAMALVVASEHLSFHGNHETSLEFVIRAERICEEGPMRDRLLGWTLRARGSSLLFAGEHEAALPAYLAAAKWFEEVGDRREYCSIGTTIGWLQATELGLHSQAEPTLRRTMAFAEELGLPGVVASAKQNLAVALMHLKRFDEAQALLEETIADFERRGDNRLCAGSLYYLVLLFTIREQPFVAIEKGRAALEIAKGVPTTTACVQAALARALLLAGENGEALQHADAAVKILAELGGIEEGESLIVLAYGEALLANGEVERARETMRAANERLHRRAMAIGDAKIREAFLQQVPEHARTAALWREMGGDGG